MESSISLQKVCYITEKVSDHVVIRRNFLIFNMAPRNLEQFNFTVYSIMNMITAFLHFCDFMKFIYLYG